MCVDNDSGKKKKKKEMGLTTLAISSNTDFMSGSMILNGICNDLFM